MLVRGFGTCSQHPPLTCFSRNRAIPLLADAPHLLERPPGFQLPDVDQSIHPSHCDVYNTHALEHGLNIGHDFGERFSWTSTLD